MEPLRASSVTRFPLSIGAGNGLSPPSDPGSFEGPPARTDPARTDPSKRTNAESGSAWSPFRSSGGSTSPW